MTVDTFRSVSELLDQIRRGTLSPVDVVEAYLKRIRERDNALNAYITVLEKNAIQKAKERERALDSKRDIGPLHGVPVAVKDLYAFVENERHTFGAKPFSRNVAESNAVLVDRLEQAGAIVIGKTNTPEFGHKGTTDNMLDNVGTTVTPFDETRTSGGSSGGSAAAVAAGLTGIAQGSDIAGSIRIPAAFCGVFGLKPSYGRIPQVFPSNAFATHTPFLSSGPLTRTVEDAALAMDVMSGPHPGDPFSAPDDEINYREAIDREISGFNIGYTADFGELPVDPEVREVFTQAVEVFSTTGATVSPITPDFSNSWDAIQQSMKVALEVFYADLAEMLQDNYGVDLLNHRNGLPNNVINRIESGRQTRAVEYKRTDAVRTDVLRTFESLFNEYDLLLTPTATVPPFPHDTHGPSEVDGVEIDPHHGWVLTSPFNLTGHPAASVPAGITDDGLPVGLQIVGQRFADDDVLAASATFERKQPWAHTLSG
jgi:Asp-tRNA(Asn)/Glu-tRNA(Gln) amidotransferase A subunit family amidase